MNLTYTSLNLTLSYKDFTTFLHLHRWQHKLDFYTPQISSSPHFFSQKQQLRKRSPAPTLWIPRSVQGHLSSSVASQQHLDTQPYRGEPELSLAPLILSANHQIITSFFTTGHLQLGCHLDLESQLSTPTCKNQMIQLYSSRLTQFYREKLRLLLSPYPRKILSSATPPGLKELLILRHAFPNETLWWYFTEKDTAQLSQHSSWRAQIKRMRSMGFCTTDFPNEPHLCWKEVLRDYSEPSYLRTFPSPSYLHHTWAVRPLPEAN